MLCIPTSPITSLSKPVEKKVQSNENAGRGRATLQGIALTVLFLAAALLSGCGGGGGGGDATADATAPKSSKQSSSYRLETDHPLYELTILGDLGQDNWAVAMNDNGQVVGNYRDDAGDTHVFFWQNNAMRRLATAAKASAVNNAGEVAGWLERDGTQTAFYHNGELFRLELDAQSSKAYDIDDHSRIVGQQVATERQAFLDDGETVELVAPEVTGHAAALNDLAQIVVQQETDSGSRSLLVENGAKTDLGTLGGDSTHATDINDGGQVVGWSLTADGTYHAFLWQDGGMIDLSADFGGPFCSAVAVNETSQVLIKSNSLGQTRNLIWQDGEITDLGNLGVDYAVVSDMNDAGEIVGWMMNETGEMRAFLATPKK